MAKLNDPSKPPTYDDYMRASMYLDPEAAATMQKGAASMKEEESRAALTDTAQVFAALRNGNVSIGADLIRKNGQAEAAAGNARGSEYAETLAKLAESGPEGAKVVENLFGFQISALPGGKDVFDSLSKLETERREADMYPIKKAQAQAELDKLEAERDPSLTISDSGTKIINDSVIKAIDADKAAVQSDNLADAFDKLRPPSGWGANAFEQFKKIAGGQDRYTALKQEYIKMRNTDALKNLPPGAASDKDIEAAMASFPEETSNPDLIASFMRGTAKLQRYTAAVEKAKAEWINQNGSLASARGDFSAGKQTVKKGTQFWDFAAGIPIPNVVGGRTATTQTKPVEVDY